MTISSETTSFIETAIRQRIAALGKGSAARGPMFMTILAKHEIAELKQVLEQLEKGASVSVTSK